MNSENNSSMSDHAGPERFSAQVESGDFELLNKLGDQKRIFWPVAATAFALSLFHMAQTQFLLVSTDEFKVVHLLVAILIVMVMGLSRDRNASVLGRFVIYVGIVAAAVVTAYFFTEYDSIIGERAYKASTLDLVVSVTLLLIALMAAYLQWGIVIPMLAIVAMAYAYWGDWFEADLLWHGGIGFTRLMSYTSFPGFQGLLGGLTELSAGTVFLFMVYASVLRDTGGLNLIMRLASGVGARSRSAPAQMAVVGSGLMGMISGSTVANIASTGSITIPMMKRQGFSPNFAGAVEAVASMGGQITPPVMGLAAFLLVVMSSTDYLTVISAAALPAFVYYAYVFLAVRIRAQALEGELSTDAGPHAVPGSDRRDETNPNSSRIRDAQVLIGIAVLITLLINGLPPAFSALYSIVTLLALNSARLLWEYRQDLKTGGVIAGRTMWTSLVDGGVSGAQIASIVAVCGVLIDILAITGFEQRLAFSIIEFAEGNLILLLIVTAASCMVFGLGLPTSAAYVVVALLGAPALIEVGVPVLAAHFFVLYFANVSSLTPPVAIAAMVASKVAGGDFLKTTFTAIRLGLPGFLLPFVFVAHPQILGVDASFAEAAFFAATTFVGIAAFNVAIEGFLTSPVSKIERGVLVVAAGLTLAPDLMATFCGLAAMTPTIVLQIAAAIRARNLHRETVES